MVQQPIIEHGRHAMIGTVDRISLSNSGVPLTSRLEKVLDGWFPYLLRKAGGVQEDQGEVLVGTAISMFGCATVIFG